MDRSGQRFFRIVVTADVVSAAWRNYPADRRRAARAKESYLFTAGIVLSIIRYVVIGAFWLPVADAPA